MIEDAKARFIENDEISQRHGNVVGLLLNPLSIAECHKLLNQWDDALETGKLLCKRAVLYKDAEKQVASLVLQVEALRALNRDSSQEEAAIAAVNVPPEKKAAVAALLAKLEKK